MEEILVEKLIELGFTISTAESCTGGLVAATIVNVSGASSVFNEGFITYSNEAKQKHLNVKEDTLLKHGAVSEETVREMLIGCADNAKSDVAIATSGIAGPGGGTKEKPVGLVYIGCYVKGEIKVTKNIFSGDRTKVREQSVNKAIELAVDMLKYK